MGGGEGGDGREGIDGRIEERGGVWGLGESHLARPLLAGWLVVFWLVCRWVEGGVKRGEGQPGTKKGSLLGWHVLVASR